METFYKPLLQDWEKISTRPSIDLSSLQSLIQTIFKTVDEKGDQALIDYTNEFDKVKIDDLLVPFTEFEDAEKEVDSSLIDAMKVAITNIEKFHKAQVSKKEIVETMPGVTCWRENRGIESVGLYIPGGTAPLFSTVLMLGIPAKIAGCKNIILTSPPNKQGKIHPAILTACNLIGINKVYKVGGAQAIAALSIGTNSILKVNKIFGPGNQYVTAAKQFAQLNGTAIDMPAGPSEVLVFADDTANAKFIASDLLSQAEHGVDSQVVFVSLSQQLIEDVKSEVKKQVNQLSRKKIALQALEFARFIYFDDIDEAWEFTNQYGPEHLIVCVENASEEIENITNAGSVFIGNFSPESAGDYASGTNHTLPTNGFAKSYSGVSLDSFVKKITFQELTKQGLKNIGESVIEMATAEELTAHANAVKIRLNHE